jgi:hypothetical protein
MIKPQQVLRETPSHMSTSRWSVWLSSQAKLLITNYSFCIVQRVTAQSKTGISFDYGVTEAPPGFKAGWSDCMYFSLSFCSFCPLIWVFRVSFCTHEGTLPFRSSAQMSCREEVGVSIVVTGVLEPQIARHCSRSAATSRHLTHVVGRSLLWRAFFRVRPQFIFGHPRGQGLSTQLVKKWSDREWS